MATATIESPITKLCRRQALARPQWQILAAAHRQRWQKIALPHLQRRSNGQAHPIYDFIFDYYHFRISKLEAWLPGPDTVLQDAFDFPAPHPYFSHDAHGGLFLDKTKIPPGRKESWHWILRLLENTQQRSPQFNCHGLHEWAMVYRADTVRHATWPLRLPADEIDALVQAMGPCCTHFDAFRFFTPDAAPLNRWSLQRDSQQHMEQPACLHTNMDLYKWAFKAHPCIPTSLTLECLALAIDIRELDMRASPYDFSALGFDPVRIETIEGRQLYQSMQKNFAARARPLRQTLIDCYRSLLS